MRRPLKDLWEKKSLLKENYFCFGAAPVGHPHGRDPGHEERNTLIRNLLASKIILSRSVCVCWKNNRRKSCVSFTNADDCNFTRYIFYQSHKRIKE
jgi:hypothetical protein